MCKFFKEGTLKTLLTVMVDFAGLIDCHFCRRVDNAVFKTFHNLVYGGLFCVLNFLKRRL